MDKKINSLQRSAFVSLCIAIPSYAAVLFTAVPSDGWSLMGQAPLTPTLLVILGFLKYQQKNSSRLVRGVSIALWGSGTALMVYVAQWLLGFLWPWDTVLDWVLALLVICSITNMYACFIGAALVSRHPKINEAFK